MIPFEVHDLTNLEEAIRETSAEARDRIVRLFKYVEALYERRNPPIRQISQYAWLLRLADLPDHAAIDLTPPLCEQSGEGNGGTEDERILLRCSRPDRTDRPVAPDVLGEWLGRDWDDPRSTSAPVSSRNRDDGQEPERFEDDAERVEALSLYRGVWDLWAENERRAVAAGEVFEKLYELYGTLQRDGERYELVVADGVLVWRRPDGGIRHPLLLRTLRLAFTPEIPEFRVLETDDPTEFYASVFMSMTDVDGAAIGQRRSEAETLGLHPLGSSDTDGFLRAVAATLSSRGVFQGDGMPGAERDEPAIGRVPMLLLRPRTTGLARAIAAVVEDAQKTPAFPPALLNIVGTPSEVHGTDAIAGDSSAASIFADANADDAVLFTKPANAEQLDIARCLERKNCVLVQGPPGTGKTHTIANLVGHLLAQGKSVLVASHTTKALKVLRDKVVEPLQPLCVSVLDSTKDDEALKNSIEGIVERIGNAELGRLDREVQRFEAERSSLVAEVRDLQRAIVNARMDERRPIVVGGEGTSPIEAAKEVAAGIGRHDWIPSPVVLGEPLPLTVGELADLYATNLSVSHDDESLLLEPLPDLTNLPTPEQFADLAAERGELASVDRGHRLDLWEPEAGTDVDVLDRALEGAREALRMRERLPTWSQRLVDLGGVLEERRSWHALLSEIDAVRNDVLAVQELLLVHDPRIAGEFPHDRAVEIYETIAREVERTRKPPGFLALATRREWKLAVEGARIGENGKPRTPEHFAALAGAARVAHRRENLRRRWALQVETIGGPAASELGTEVEIAAQRFSALVAAALDWSSETWKPAAAGLCSVGFCWEAVSVEADTRFPEADRAGRISRAMEELVPAAFAAEHARRRWNAIEGRLRNLLSEAEAWSPSPLANGLRRAVADLSTNGYRENYLEIVRLRALTAAVRERTTLLRRLERAAPGWAAQIRTRQSYHGEGRPPGDAAMAWRWRQFEDELQRRHGISLSDLMVKLEASREQLRDTTAELVDRKAWRAQAARTTLAQRGALLGFAQAKKRLGRGTGKTAAKFARVARQEMTQARSAVPVWIMPIVKAAEVFDPRSTRFDVVIVDEASQSDVTGLLALYLGKQIVIVGDDEQVSPSAVGEKVDDVQHLIDAFLQGIPRAQLYDGKYSLYDIAKASFGDTICLVEHFRCVPDIIRFSNALSYNGKIKPLREAAPIDPQPALVAHRVSARGSERQVNEDEARAIASLIAAAIEQPEYAGKTFGVVSMVGEAQAYRIEEILRRILPPAEVEARRLLSGSAAQFQGDERNVMFLSLVDTGTGTPLPKRDTAMFKQRFNVATSRAQDQMWIVYSLDPSTELQPEDLRRRLIDHALDPKALDRNAAAALAKADSPFEREVIERLSAAGYRVKAQYPVGAYRVDMVIEGQANRKLAIECDGDRYHRIEDLEQDAQRQAIIERVSGLTFVRIRGSRFYRDRDAAMMPVFDRLADLGIAPMASNLGEAPVVDEVLLERIRVRAAEITSELDAQVEGRPPRRRRVALESDLEADFAQRP